MKNKKKNNQGRLLLIILIVVLVLFYIINAWRRNYTQNVYENTYNIVLFGDYEVSVYEGEEYQEEGYLALDYNYQDKTELVKINDNVNYNQVGDYEIKYEINTKYKDNIATRKIHVVNNPLKEVEFSLNGDSEINTLVDSYYDDEGFTANRNGEDFSTYVSVLNDVDLTRVGQYEINYLLKIGSQEKKLTRIVNVISNFYSVKYSTLEIVNNEVSVTVTSNISNFNYFKDIDGKVVNISSYTFKAAKNGDYYVQMYDRNNKVTNIDIKVKNIDKTPPTGTCIASILNKIKSYSVSASDDNKEYTTSSFKVSYLKEDDSITIYDIAGNKKTIICEYLPLTNRNNNVIARYNSNTLKYVIEKPKNNYTVTHIWVKDVTQQLKTEVNQSTPGTVELATTFLSNAIKRNGYSNKGMISVNASGFIMSSDNFWKYSGWQNNTYHYSSRAPIIISDGRIRRDWTRDVLPSELYALYGLKANGYLDYYKYKSGSNNVSNNIEVTNQIKNDGVINTFTFAPALLKNYKNLVNGRNMTSSNLRQAICQIDRNNFVIVTNLSSSNNSNSLSQSDRDRGFSHKSMASYMETLGCRTAFNMDGGGSISLYYKTNSSTINNVRTSSRKVADILYFVEK